MRRISSSLGVVAIGAAMVAASACGSSSQGTDAGSVTPSSSGSGSGNGSGSSGAGGSGSGASSSGAGGSGVGSTGTSSGAASSSGAVTSSGDGSSGASSGSGSSGASGADGGGGSGSSTSAPDSGSSGVVATGAACPVDPNVPKEPVDPPVCTTLTATKSTPDEAALDTSRIQAALNGCGAGKAVKLTSSGANNAFVTARLTINGTTLMVDAGTTLYASRNPSSYGCSAGTGAAANSCGAVIDVSGSRAGIVGGGIIDGQGGEPIVGMSQSWWDVSVALRASNGSSSNPALISVSNATNFVMHNIHIYNSPKFHVKLASAGYVVWGVEILTPSKPTNSMGAALTPYGARNTDGFDPGGGSPTSNGYLVCSKISVGDDEVAIKAGKAHVSNLTFAHNHFGVGHGMSIGSETGAGASNINVYDLTIDGSIPTGGSPDGDRNGIRIKSYNGNGGPVDKVSYSDVCIRDLPNPILLNPNYTMGSGMGGGVPKFTNISLKNIQVSGGGTVTLDGFDSSNLSTVTLDNVVVDGNPKVIAQNATITLGPGGINFPPPMGTGVTVMGPPGKPTPIDCSSRWVTFP